MSFIYQPCIKHALYINNGATIEAISNIQDFHMWASFVIIAFAILAYANDKLPMELVSITLLSVLLVFFHFFPLLSENGSEILPASKLLSGFANTALISVIALLVLGQAIVKTGAINEVANIVLRISRNSAFLAIAISLIFVAVVSAFLNNTPVVVIFIPIMAALSKAINKSVSRVMIPLSYASILGGMTTLVGSSTNLLVSGIMSDMGFGRLSFFEFFYPAIFLVGAGLFYVLFILPRLLPDRASLVKSFAGDGDRQFIAQIEIDYSSDFVGKKLHEGAIPGFPDIPVRMIQRGEHAFLPPFEEDILIRPRDIIVVAGGKKELSNFFASNPDAMEKPLADYGHGEEEEDIDLNKDVTMAEIVVVPSSKVVGKTLEQLRFHQEYNCVALGIQRQSRVIRAKVTEIRLAPGDVLLVMGPRENVMALHENRDFLLLEWSAEEIHTGDKGVTTAIIFGLVVSFAAFEIMPIYISAFAGVAAVLITKCINWRQAARAMDMNIALLIGASIALGAALQASGGASYLAHQLISAMHGFSPIYIMSAMFLLMMIVTNILSNNASAVLFTPIAINLATQLGVDPKMFIFAVIFACNCSFVTPIGYQTNLMVMGPGHHKFSDFIKSGIPLALIVWVTYSIFTHFYFGY